MSCDVHIRMGEVIDFVIVTKILYSNRKLFKGSKIESHI
jgi:hypothetical protein